MRILVLFFSLGLYVGGDQFSGFTTPNSSKTRKIYVSLNSDIYLFFSSSPNIYSVRLFFFLKGRKLSVFSATKIFNYSAALFPLSLMTFTTSFSLLSDLSCILLT